MAIRESNNFLITVKCLSASTEAIHPGKFHSYTVHSLTINEINCRYYLLVVLTPVELQ